MPPATRTVTSEPAPVVTARIPVPPLTVAALDIAMLPPVVAEIPPAPPLASLPRCTRCQSLAMPSFADIVAKVRPAVVSVKVKIEAANMNEEDGPDFAIPDLPPGHPMVTGEQTNDFELFDTENANLVIAWGMNWIATKMPDAHWLT